LAAYRASLQRGTVGAICELDGVLGELSKTGDGEILLVGLGGFEDGLGLLTCQGIGELVQDIYAPF
jgi:hypothetical protein